jgi:hypothetical protein
MYITHALIGRNPCLDQAIQTKVNTHAKDSDKLDTEYCRYVLKLFQLFYNTNRVQ